MRVLVAALLLVALVGVYAAEPVADDSLTQAVKAARVHARDAQAAVNTARKSRNEASATYKAAHAASDAAAKIATDAANEAKLSQAAAADAKKTFDAAHLARRAFHDGELAAADAVYKPLAAAKAAKDAEAKTLEASFATVSGFPVEVQPELKEKLNAKKVELDAWSKTYEEAKARSHKAHEEYRKLKETALAKSQASDAAAKAHTAKQAASDAAATKSSQAGLVSSNAKKALEDAEAKLKAARAARDAALKALGHALKARTKAYGASLDTLKTQENTANKVVAENEAALAKLRAERAGVNGHLKDAKAKQHRQEGKLSKLQAEKDAASKEESKTKAVLETTTTHRKVAQEGLKDFTQKNPEVTAAEAPAKSA